MAENNIHELLQQYIDGTIPNDEIDAFELKLKNDPILKQEYELILDIESEFKNTELMDFKNQLSSVSNDYFQATNKQKKGPKIIRFNRRILSIAASLLVLIGGVIWGINRGGNNLQTAHYDFSEIYSETVKSGNPNLDTRLNIRKKEIISLIEENKYQEAIDILKTNNNNNNDDESLSLLLGHALLSKSIAEGDNDVVTIQDVVQTTLPLSKSNKFSVKYEAEWILLLAYSKSSKYQSSFNELLESILNNVDHSFHAQAKEIKEHMK